MVVLSDDRELREQMEHALVEMAIEHDYDAVASYSLAPDVFDVNSRNFLRALANGGIQTVLMLRPSAIGPGSSLDSVREEVSPEMFSRMREFAGEVSTAGSGDLIAVVHLGIYALEGSDATLLSSGAVWLDEDVPTRDEGVARLLELIVTNIDQIRPAIRRHLGLPPLN